METMRSVARRLSRRLVRVGVATSLLGTATASAVFLFLGPEESSGLAISMGTPGGVPTTSAGAPVLAGSDRGTDDGASAGGAVETPGVGAPSAAPSVGKQPFGLGVPGVLPNRFGIRWDERARQYNPDSPFSSVAIDEGRVRPDDRHELRAWVMENRPLLGMPVLVACALSPAPDASGVFGMILVRPAGEGEWRVLKRDSVVGVQLPPLEHGHFDAVAHVSCVFEKDHGSTRTDLILATPGRYEVKARVLLKPAEGASPDLDWQSVESRPIDIEVVEPTSPGDRAALVALRGAKLFEGPSVPTRAHSASDLDAFLADHGSSAYGDYARFERAFYLNEPQRYPELEDLLVGRPGFGLRDRLAYELFDRAVVMLRSQHGGDGRQTVADRLATLERVSHDSLWTERARRVAADLIN
jgi:hypothetical protein